jgi:hypothetical protein
MLLQKGILNTLHLQPMRAPLVPTADHIMTSFVVKSFDTSPFWAPVDAPIEASVDAPVDEASVDAPVDEAVVEAAIVTTAADTVSAFVFLGMESSIAREAGLMDAQDGEEHLDL